jgi:hypothetical protein
MTVFFEHMAEEEHLLPELRGAVGTEALMELGGRCVGRDGAQHGLDRLTGSEAAAPAGQG